MVPAPEGTFLGRVHSGALQLPGTIHQYCLARGWTLMRVLVLDDHRLELRPVLPDEDLDGDDGDVSSLCGDGKLWIPKTARNLVHLAEQSVMVRVEGDCVRIYTRRIFETLGFRP